MGALIGDWLAAHEAAIAGGDATILAVTAPKAEACREQPLAWLQETIDDTDNELADEALRALHDLGAHRELKTRLEEILRGPITLRNTAMALDVISELSNDAWCPAVEELWNRLTPDGGIPQPYLWLQCVEFLLSQNYHTDDILADLPKAGETALVSAALIALERAPELALPLFRRALRSSAGVDRTEAAAVLALIDQPWCHSELLSVLNESDDWDATAACRAGLLESRVHNIHSAALAWESKHPAEHATGIERKLSVVFPERVPDSVKYSMEKWHDRVMPIRTRLPPKPE